MGLREYQYVLKVAELKNMTRAAEALYITQPSLSHYIARVEEELGVQLFNRLTTPISLTPEGEKYVETAQMILNLDGSLKRELSEMAKGKSGILTTGMSHARASFLLPYVLPQFKELHPRIEIRTLETKSSVLEEYVAKEICDLGIMPFPVSGKFHLEQEGIFREELLLVSGKPLAAGRERDGERPYIRMSELTGNAFTLLKKGHGIRTAADVLFLEHGIKPSQIFETTSNETAYRLASVNMALAIVPETTVILSNAVKKPYLYSLSREGIFWEIGAVFRKREMMTKAQRDFIDLLKKSLGNSGLSL